MDLLIRTSGETRLPDFGAVGDIGAGRPGQASRRSGSADFSFTVAASTRAWTDRWRSGGARRHGRARHEAREARRRGRCDCERRSVEAEPGGAGDRRRRSRRASDGGRPRGGRVRERGTRAGSAGAGRRHGRNRSIRNVRPRGG